MKPLAAFIVLFLPSILFAWGGDGHQIVALIAEERLTPEAKAGIHELLGKDVDISDAEVASWADVERRAHPDQGPWHYVDIPTDADGFDEARDGAKGNNVIDALTKFEKILADKSAAKDDRTEALKYVVHFAGDIEQPLHCAERGHDRGGNTRVVFFLDRRKAVNLHQCWNTQILLHDKGNARILDYAQWLNDRISGEYAKRWAKGTPEDWANESHRVAVEAAYKGVPADGNPPKLDEKYVERAEPVIREQLERAGVRLAEVLNRALH